MELQNKIGNNLAKWTIIYLELSSSPHLKKSGLWDKLEMDNTRKEKAERFW